MFGAKNNQGEKKNDIFISEDQKAVKEDNISVGSMDDDLNSSSSGAEPESYSKIRSFAKNEGTSPWSDNNEANPNAVAESGNDISSAPKAKWNRILVITVVILTIATFMAGGYYYWITHKGTEQVETVVNSQGEEPQIEVTEKKFSDENPNVLAVDTETIKTADLQQLLIQKSNEVKEDGHGKPVEFIVNDLNNNPIAFSRFAIISGIKISASVLDNLEEKFSLYFYNDGGNMRLGIVISLKNKDNAVQEMRDEEIILADDIIPLFLGNEVMKEGVIFKDGNYNNSQIRYANLNSEGTVSLDYSFVGLKLVIGTSKNTTRAVIDKISKESN